MLKTEEKKIKYEMSQSMVENIKNDIKKHKNFYDFLETVKAQKNNVVLKYNNSLIEKYEEKFVKKYHSGLNDMFIFQDVAKLKNGFIPRIFWDKVWNTYA